MGDKNPFEMVSKPSDEGFVVYANSGSFGTNPLDGAVMRMNPEE
jgi:hypothetical protein